MELHKIFKHTIKILWKKSNNCLNLPVKRWSGTCKHVPFENRSFYILKAHKGNKIFIAYWMSSLWVKAAPLTNSAGLGFFRWCFHLLLQLKIKVTINNPIYPVLKWFCERCAETGTNNIQAEMFLETLKCMILGLTGVQAQQAAASLPAECQCRTEQSQIVVSALLQRGCMCYMGLVTGVDTKAKCTHILSANFFMPCKPHGDRDMIKTPWDFYLSHNDKWQTHPLLWLLCYYHFLTIVSASYQAQPWWKMETSNQKLALPSSAQAH